MGVHRVDRRPLTVPGASAVTALASANGKNDREALCFSLKTDVRAISWSRRLIDDVEDPRAVSPALASAIRRSSHFSQFGEYVSDAETDHAGRKRPRAS